MSPVALFPFSLSGTIPFAESVMILGAILSVLVGVSLWTFALQREVARRTKALAETQSKFTAAFHASPDGIMITRKSDGVVLEVNESLLKLTGYRREQVIGESTLLLFWTNVVDRTAMLEKLIAEGAIRNYPVRVSIATDELRDFVVSAEPLDFGEERCLLSVVRDVTDAKRQQEALEQSERKFAAVFRLGPVAMILTRLHDGKILDVNEGFTTLYGWSREETIGKTALDLNLYDSPEERARYVPILRQDGRIRNLEARRQRKDGTWIDVNASAELIDLDGVQHLISSVIDITPQKRAERLLKEANATLEQRVADRTSQLEFANQELESFSYTVSHDLRAPLRTIDGFSQALVEDYRETLDAGGQQFLDRIRNAARRMGQLIDDLIALSKVTREPLHRTTIHLSELVERLGNRCRLARPDQPVDFKVTPGLTVNADRQLIEIVLANLLDNAWKYSSGKPALIEFGSEIVDGQTRYFVRDNGAGFDPQYAHKLFKPFQRLHTPAEFPGNGIGLATVRRIVFRHGGQVWSSGEPGRGATFSFSIGTGGGLPDF